MAKWQITIWGEKTHYDACYECYTRAEAIRRAVETYLSGDMPEIVGDIKRITTKEY